MQIGGLGYVNTLASASSDKIQGNIKMDFSRLFQSLQNGVPAKDIKDLSQQKGISLQDVSPLISFLGINRLEELDGGFALQGQLMGDANADILQMVKNYLGITDGKWNELIKSLTSSIPEKGNSFLLEGANTEPKEKALDNDSLLDEVANILAGLLSMPQEKLAVDLNKDLPLFLKSVKLLELLGNNQDNIAGSKKVTALLNDIKKVLESLAVPDKGSLKTEFLQTTFTRLAGELNQNTLKKDNLNEVYLDKPSGKESTLELTGKENTPGQLIGKESNLGQLIGKESNLGQLTGKEKNLGQLSGKEIPLGQITGSSVIHHQMPKVEQITLMLQNNGKPVTSNQLIQQFESILSKSQLLKSGGMQKLLVNLNPEHLGSLRVELIQKDQAIIARILTTTGTAKDTLESHLNGLKQAFAAQNIQVERIEIAQQFNQQERFLNREQHQNPQQQQNRQQDRQERQNASDFDLSLEEALVNMEA